MNKIVRITGTCTLLFLLSVPIVSQAEEQKLHPFWSDSSSKKLEEITQGLKGASDERIKASRLEGKYPQMLYERWLEGDADALLQIYQLAKEGDSNAQTVMGVLLDRGIGFPQDSSEAFTYLVSAAPAKNQVAHYNLGVLYMQGRGVTRNVDAALDWFSKAERYPPAAMQIALYAMEQKDEETALLWARQAARSQNLDGLYLSGRLYLNAGQDTAGFLNINKAARAGHGRAVATISALYRNGIGTNEDIGLSIGWWIIDEAYNKGRDLEELITEATRFNATSSDVSKGARYARRFLMNRERLPEFDYTQTIMYGEYKR